MKRCLLYIAGILVITLVVACQVTTENQVPPVEYRDLVGTWMADYSQYDVSLPRAKETLILNANGTFEQIFEATMGRRRSVAGKWSTEEMDDAWTRVYLVGASYYLQGISVAKDPDFEMSAWDPVLSHHVPTGNKSGLVILYATRLLLDSTYNSQIPCGKKGDVILQHLPIGDLDAPTWVTFCKE